MGPMGPPGTPGQKGDPGQPGPGLETNLTRITALSWVHAQSDPPQALLLVPKVENGIIVGFEPGLVIAFTGEINFPVDSPVFEVSALVNVPNTNLIAECFFSGSITPVTVTKITNHLVNEVQFSGQAPPNGLAFVPDDPNIVNFGVLRVYFRGDFVIDTAGKAVCCDFVRGGFDTGEIPAGSGLGLEGGLFFSWFEAQGD